MEHPQDEGPAVQTDFLPAQTRAYIAPVSLHPLVTSREDQADDENDGNANGDGYCKLPHFYALVDDRFCAMRSAGAEMAMKHLWSRSTSKTLAPTRKGCESELARADTV
jgi:hypothetical protein